MKFLVQLLVDGHQQLFGPLGERVRHQGPPVAAIEAPHEPGEVVLAGERDRLVRSST
jgi:hypothetical protein